MNPPPKDIFITHHASHALHSRRALSLAHAERFQNRVSCLLDVAPTKTPSARWNNAASAFLSVTSHSLLRRRIIHFMILVKASASSANSRRHCVL
jgi:hypothetical protein